MGSILFPVVVVVSTFEINMQEEGGRALFAGAKTRMAWISIGGAIFFGGFEEFRRQLTKLNE